MSNGSPDSEHEVAAHRRLRLWAVVVVVFVLTVFVATLAGQTLVSRARIAQARHAQPVVAAPALPALHVISVAHPEAGALLIAYDHSTSYLVTLASTSEPFCPPVGPCQTVRADAFALLDGASGQLAARTPLTGAAAAAADATLLLDDPVRRQAYAIAPDMVTIFSSASGAYVGRYALAHGAPWSGATLDPATGRLFLVGNGRVLALDAASGALVASAALPVTPDAAAPDGPVYDPARRLLYIIIRPNGASDAPRLLALDAGTLRQVSLLALPLGVRLGPMDAGTGALDIFGGDSRGWQFDAPLATAPTLTRAPALDGALAVGGNPGLRHLYVAGFTQTLLLDARSGQALAGLPLAARWPTFQPLPVDQARHLLYLPADHGSIVIVWDGAPIRDSAGINAATSVILARAALAKLLPDTNQDPPFIAVDTFPLGAGTPIHPETRSLVYWIHFADVGWRGNYPGTASVAVTPDPDNPYSIGYLVTFTIIWRQGFERRHIWACAVAPNGTVTLRPQASDTVP
jgi:hypothetical protein